MFRSNDLQSTMFVTDTVHLVIYETRILFMTAGIHNATVVTIVSARQNLQSALCYRPPVRPSVHVSKGWMTINQKRLVKIVQFLLHLGLLGLPTTTERNLSRAPYCNCSRTLHCENMTVIHRELRRYRLYRRFLILTL